MTTYQRIVEIGRRIAKIRNHRNMTENELGAAIGRTGKSVWVYEHGRSVTAMMAHLDEIAGALSCRRADLLKPLEAPLPRGPHNHKFRAGRSSSFALSRRMASRGSFRPSIVSLLAARMLNYNPALTPDDLRSKLKEYYPWP